MLILTVPLIDQSLHMNLYKVYNLPMLHPTLHVHVQYEIENSYLATIMEGIYNIANCLGCQTMFNDEWTLMHV